MLTIHYVCLSKISEAREGMIIILTKVLIDR